MFKFCLTCCVVWLFLATQAAKAERLLVPDYVSCERNHLTSWVGFVSKFKLTENKLEISIATNEQTLEQLTLEFSSEAELLTHFYLNGEKFSPSDWQSITTSDKQLIAKTRAVVWICLDDSKPPVINWRSSSQD
ncbi:hypothetical protein [Paraglaciecola aestuariivivens]